MDWIYLGIAIVAEIVATSAMKASEGFTRLLPSVLVITGYVLASFLLSLCLRSIPVGIAYAIWSGVGIVFISVAAMVLYGQVLDGPAVVGIALILAGVLVINLMSKASVH